MIGYLILAVYLVLINGIAFAMFAIDKTAAIRGEWRVSEGTLLFLAMIGGSVGAIVAQRRLRHKTRKEPFRSTLYCLILLQLGGLAYLCVNGMPPALARVISSFK